MKGFTVLTVSQLTTYLSVQTESDEKLRDVYLHGEISNFSRNHASGHCYFYLKDDQSSLRAVMFSRSAQGLSFTPENGMAVLARGSVSFYKRDGAAQLIVVDIMPHGAGEMAVSFDQLKRRLADAGLFDAAGKKPIPSTPSVIGVVTSSNAAALQDVLRVIERRNPAAEVLHYPVPVQGEGAASMMCAAIELINRQKGCEVIILCRGGGSAEDLSQFNDERLAYAIFYSDIPVITGIGHETDFTIADFVADMRAPTPSAAAELVTPDMQDMKARLEQNRLRIQALAQRVVVDAVGRLNGLRAGCESKLSGRLSSLEQRLGWHGKLIEACSPYAVLARGYSITTFTNGDIKPGAELTTITADYVITSTVDTVRKRETDGQ